MKMDLMNLEEKLKLPIGTSKILGEKILRTRGIAKLLKILIFYFTTFITKMKSHLLFFNQNQTIPINIKLTFSRAINPI